MRLKIGHRGAAGYEPENTLRSIERAIDLGADLVEVDVQKTADNHLVIMHDKHVNRTTNGTGAIAELTSMQLSLLDAGRGERIPSLEDVLRVASGRIGVVIEIITPGIARDVLSIGRRFSVDPLIFASFHHDELLTIREEEPDALTLALIEGVPVDRVGFVRDAKVTHVGVSRDSITPSFIDTLRNEGVAVFVYTANEHYEIEALSDLPIQGVLSDFPDRLNGASTVKSTE